MFYLISVPVAIVLGTLIGFLLTKLFAKLPEAWLQDYDVKETDRNYRISKRMRWVPEGVAAAIICSVLYIVALVFCKSLYFDKFEPLHIAVIFLMAPILILIIMSDHLNRIIPDQMAIAIALIGILSIVADYTEGSMWFSPEANWYMPLLNKVLGAIIGGGLLWIIGFVTLTFSGHEGMGQGDIRLLAACGLITGCYGLIILFYVAVFSAVLFAIPMLIRKQIRLKREEEEIRRSPNPQKARHERALRKARMHFADNPDYLAFGPFLALGCGVFVIMEPIFFDQLFGILNVLGVIF